VEKVAKPAHKGLQETETKRKKSQRGRQPEKANAGTKNTVSKRKEKSLRGMAYKGYKKKKKSKTETDSQPRRSRPLKTRRRTKRKRFQVKARQLSKRKLERKRHPLGLGTLLKLRGGERVKKSSHTRQ